MTQLWSHFTTACNSDYLNYSFSMCMQLTNDNYTSLETWPHWSICKSLTKLCISFSSLFSLEIKSVLYLRSSNKVLKSIFILQKIALMNMCTNISPNNGQIILKLFSKFMNRFSSRNNQQISTLSLRTLDFFIECYQDIKMCGITLKKC